MGRGTGVATRVRTARLASPPLAGYCGSNSSTDSSPGRTPNTLRSALKTIALIAASVLATVVVVETILQIASAVVSDRRSEFTEGATIRVMAVGDSHMYGAMVQAEEAFPMQLERFLNQERPGSHSIINLGVPGMNTTQVRNRFAANLDAYRPDIALVWCGINNFWNASEATNDTGLAGYAYSLALRSRLYRMFRVWRHNREIDGKAIQAQGGSGRAPRIQETKVWRGQRGADVDIIAPQPREQRLDHEQAREQAERDYRAMVAMAAEHGTRVLFIGYPLALNEFAAPNEAMQATAKDTDSAFFGTSHHYIFLPEGRKALLPGAHPTPPLYEIFARAGASRLLQLEREWGLSAERR